MTRTSVVRRALVGLAAVGLVFASSSCSSSSNAAATVDGQTISRQMVDDLVTGLSKSSPAAKTALAGATPGTQNTAQVSNLLGYLIKEALITGAAKAEHVVPTAAQQAAAKASAASVFSSGATDATGATDDGTKTFAKLTKPLQAFLTTAAADQAALQAKLGKGVDRTAEARKAYEANKSQYVDICFSSITVKTADLTAVEQRLSSGQSFADVARAVSIDNAKAKGGANGCSALSSFSPQVAAQLTAGSPTTVKGPFQDANGNSVLVLITSSTQQTFAQAKAAVIAALPAAGTTELSALLASRTRTAHISVDPRYGRWSAAKATVVPPVDPTATTTTVAKSSTTTTAGG